MYSIYQLCLWLTSRIRIFHLCFRYKRAVVCMHLSQSNSHLHIFRYGNVCIENDIGACIHGVSYHCGNTDFFSLICYKPLALNVNITENSLALYLDKCMRYCEWSEQVQTKPIHGPATARKGRGRQRKACYICCHNSYVYK